MLPGGEGLHARCARKGTRASWPSPDRTAGVRGDDHGPVGAACCRRFHSSLHHWSSGTSCRSCRASNVSHLGCTICCHTFCCSGGLGSGSGPLRLVSREHHFQEVQGALHACEPLPQCRCSLWLGGVHHNCLEGREGKACSACQLRGHQHAANTRCSCLHCCCQRFADCAAGPQLAISIQLADAPARLPAVQHRPIEREEGLGVANHTRLGILHEEKESAEAGGRARVHGPVSAVARQPALQNRRPAPSFAGCSCRPGDKLTGEHAAMPPRMRCSAACLGESSSCPACTCSRQHGARSCHRKHTCPTMCCSRGCSSHMQ